MNIEQRIIEFRHAPIDRKSQRPGDKFLGFWIYIKTFAMQGSRRRQIKQCTNYLHKFFETGELAEIIAENPEQAWSAIAEQCYESAKLLIETCLKDRNYGSKFFNLMPLKSEELELKIEGDRDLIVDIIQATDFPQKGLITQSYQRGYRTVMEKV